MKEVSGYETFLGALLGDGIMACWSRLRLRAKALTPHYA
jgi:hypothetical protein